MVSRRTVLGGIGGALAMPGSLVRAAGKARAVVADMAVEDDRAWLAAKIGDQGPFLFAVDTGGTFSFINNDLAVRLGLKLISQDYMGGVGGERELPIYRADDLRLANGFILPRMLFYGAKRPIGGDAAGTLGAGLFTSYDSDLDFGRGQWRLWPEGRPDLAGFTQLRSRFLQQRGGLRIVAHAALDGVDRVFLLDTGNPGEVSLDHRAARDSGLWRDDRPYAPYVVHGIGPRGLPGRLVRGRALAIGPKTIDRPLVFLAAPGQFETAGQVTAGQLGLGVLAHLNLATQRASQTVWVQPNGLNYPRQGYGMSGLSIDFDRGGVIGDVGTGSPAAAAGIKPGDRVIGDQATVSRALDGRAGTTVPLTFERDGQRRDVALTLVDYL